MTLDAAGDRAMTERFIAEVIQQRRPAFGLLWCGEPDHIQHNVPLGSPEHCNVLREADRNAGMVIDAVVREREPQAMTYSADRCLRSWPRNGQRA